MINAERAHLQVIVFAWKYISYNDIFISLLTCSRHRRIIATSQVLSAPKGRKLRGKPERPHVGKAGAAPATVSGELLPERVTDASASGRRGDSGDPQARRPARDRLSPRAGCPCWSLAADSFLSAVSRMRPLPSSKQKRLHAFAMEHFLPLLLLGAGAARLLILEN